MDALSRGDSSELHGLVRMELAQLQIDLKAALQRKPEAITRAHILSLLDDVRDVIDPRPGTDKKKTAIAPAAVDPNVPAAGCFAESPPPAGP